MKPNPTQIIDLIEDEVELRILLAIDLFGSLNLKNIAKVIATPESTTLRKIKELLQQDALILDQQQTLDHRGKYYSLHPRIKQILAQDDDSTRFLNKEDPESYIVPISNAIRGLANFNQSINEIFSQYVQLGNNAQTFVENKTHISNSMMFLKFRNQDDLDEFHGLWNDFVEKISKFENNPDPTDPKLQQYLYLASLPIGHLDINKF